MKRMLNALLVSGLVTALVAALLVALPPTDARAQGEKVTLRLDFFAQAAHAGLAWGVEKGIYAEHGIDLKMLEGTGSGPTTQAIAADTDRFGFADAFTMAKLAAKGLPVRMIANYVQTSPNAIIFMAEKDIKSLKDLEGKKVSFTSGDSLHQLFPALLKVNRIDPARIQEVLLAPQAKAGALMSGAVDAMGGLYTAQAGSIQRESGKPVGYLRYADFGVNMLTHGLLINTKYLGQKSLNCKMVAATSRAWQAGFAEPDRAVEALHKLFPKVNKGDKDLSRQQWAEYGKLLYTKNSQGKPAGQMMKEDWEALLALGQTYGGIDPAKPAADYYTNEFFSCG
jgi:NitT/TauT family transport system substrate-binding protein